MDKNDLMLRARTFSLNVITLVEGFPRNKGNDLFRCQLVKSSASVGANFGQAIRAESKADFIHKIGMVEKEASGTEWRLELLKEGRLPDPAALGWALKKCRELLRIFTAT